MQRADARRATGGAGAVADQRRGVFEQLAMELEHARREADTSRIDLEDRHGGQLRGYRPHLRHRAEVARVAHQAQARHVAQRMRDSLQAGLERLSAERAP